MLLYKLQVEFVLGTVKVNSFSWMGVFCVLSGLVGSYLVRVCAQNLAGRGACSVDELVTFIGG